MILYNVTINIDESVHLEWVEWMKSKHIPDVLDTGCFSGYKFLKLLNEQEGAEGITYCVQYFCQDMKTLHKYIAHHAPALQNEHTTKYQGKFVAFRTLLETI